MFGLALPFLISQLLAGVALVSDLIGFQMEKREHILLFCAFTVFCLSVHHYLLGNLAASIILGLAVIRYIVSIFIQRKLVVLFFLVLSIVAFVFTYEKIEDYLILIGTFFLTIAAFQKDEKHLRIINMLGFAFYMMFNILIFSPFGILARFSVFSSNAIGYYRYHFKK